MQKEKKWQVPEEKFAIDDGIEGIGAATCEDSGIEIAEIGSKGVVDLASFDLISKSKIKTNKKAMKISIMLNAALLQQ